MIWLLPPSSAFCLIALSCVSWASATANYLQVFSHASIPLCFLKKYIYLFIYLWLCRVFAVARGLLSSCCAACGILVPRPGIDPASPALEGRFLTAGPPGKSFLSAFVLCYSLYPECLPHLVCLGNSYLSSKAQLSSSPMLYPARISYLLPCMCSFP